MSCNSTRPCLEKIAHYINANAKSHFSKVVDQRLSFHDVLKQRMFALNKANEFICHIVISRLWLDSPVCAGPSRKS